MRSSSIVLLVALAGCSRTPARANGNQDAAPLVSVARADASAAPAKQLQAVPDGGTDAKLGCAVTVARLIDAEVFRGPGVDSPARQKTLEGLPPGTRERWAGRDHGVKHLACTYSVSVNNVRYRYRHNAEQSFTGGELDTKKCSLAATQRTVEKDIRELTKECSDLRAGEYWGHRLEPEAP